MTDVNIATAMLTDAYRDRFDTALLVSADSDLVPPVRAARMRGVASLPNSFAHECFIDELAFAAGVTGPRTRPPEP